MTFIPPRPDDNGCCPHCGQEMTLPAVFEELMDAALPRPKARFRIKARFRYLGRRGSLPYAEQTE